MGAGGDSCPPARQDETAEEDNGRAAAVLLTIGRLQPSSSCRCVSPHPWKQMAVTSPTTASGQGETSRGLALLGQLVGRSPTGWAGKLPGLKQPHGWAGKVPRPSPAAWTLPAAGPFLRPGEGRGLRQISSSSSCPQWPGGWDRGLQAGSRGWQWGRETLTESAASLWLFLHPSDLSWPLKTLPAKSGPSGSLSGQPLSRQGWHFQRHLPRGAEPPVGPLHRLGLPLPRRPPAETLGLPSLPQTRPWPPPTGGSGPLQPH